MSQEQDQQPFDWAEQFFRGDYEVAPKYRDMLALVAAKMMGDRGAAEHFYDRALVDGATDDELRRVVEIGQSAGVSLGDPSAQPKKSMEAKESPNDQANLSEN